MLRLVIFFFIFDLMGAMGGEDDTVKQKNQELFAWSLAPVFARLSEVTAEEVIIRDGVVFHVVCGLLCGAGNLHRDGYRRSGEWTDQG